jgi:cytochrome c oxidase assembly factor CtaG
MPLPEAHVAGTLAPLQLLPLFVLAALYWKRTGALARRGKPVPGWRQACFGSGLVLIAAAFTSPVGHIADELLLAHMAEHLLVADIGTLLLVLGLTGPVLQPVLAIRAFDRLRVLAHPLVALPLWALDLYVWHLPALYQAALGSEAVHALEHAMFIGFGILMWMPLAGPLPKPRWFGTAAKVGYVVAVRLAGTVLANVFMWSGKVFYPDYAAGEAHWNITPLADQSTAGVIMMIEGSLVTLGLLAWVFLLWGRQADERQALIEYAEERGIALDEARAERAVEAGRGRELADRLAGKT